VLFAFGIHRIDVVVPAVANDATVAVLADVPNVSSRSRKVPEPTFPPVWVERNTLAFDVRGT